MLWGREGSWYYSRRTRTNSKTKEHDQNAWLDNDHNCWPDPWTVTGIYHNWYGRAQYSCDRLHKWDRLWMAQYVGSTYLALNSLLTFLAADSWKRCPHHIQNRVSTDTRDFVWLVILLKNIPELATLTAVYINDANLKERLVKKYGVREVGYWEEERRGEDGYIYCYYVLRSNSV